MGLFTTPRAMAASHRLHELPQTRLGRLSHSSDPGSDSHWFRLPSGVAGVSLRMIRLRGRFEQFGTFVADTVDQRHDGDRFQFSFRRWLQ